MTVKKRKQHDRLSKIMGLILAGILIAVIVLEWRVKPFLDGFAEVNARSLATAAINQSVAEVLDEMEITCEDLETITCSDNRITSIHCNTMLTNKLKSAITLRIQKHLSDIVSRELHIPLGSLLGGELMQGRGPAIPVNISVSGNINSDFESELEQGGINQTVHKLSVRVSADLSVRQPQGMVHTSVETTVLIGETVIIGEVPAGMLYRTA